MFSDVGEGEPENVIDVAEDVRLNLCSGGKYPDHVAYVQKNFAPVSFCQRHCEDCKLLITLYLVKFNKILNFSDPMLPICTRMNRPPVVKNGCVCAPGFIRELNTDDCVLPADCESK